MEFWTRPVEIPMWVAVVLGLNGVIHICHVLWVGFKPRDE
jgi:hypothetical protein